MSSDSPVARLREPLFSALRQMTGEPFSDWSLRLRLSVCFTLFLACAWVLIALFSWHENRKYINRFFDTQQMIFAKTLLAMEPGGQMAGFPPGIPKDGEILRGVLREARGNRTRMPSALRYSTVPAAGCCRLPARHPEGRGNPARRSPGSQGKPGQECPRLCGIRRFRPQAAGRWGERAAFRVRGRDGGICRCRA